MTEKLHPSQAWTTSERAARARLADLHAECLKYRLTRHPIPPTIDQAITETETAIAAMTNATQPTRTAFLCSPQFAAALTANIRAATRQIHAIAYLARLPAASAPPVIHALWAAILDAPKHCPDCHLILQATHDLAKTRETNKHTAETLRCAGWRVTTPPDNITTHAKIWLFDNQCLTVGSHNLTTRALTSSVEASVTTTDPNAINAARAALTHLNQRIARAKKFEAPTKTQRSHESCPA